MVSPTTARYGSWRSPISIDLIVAETIGLGTIVLDGVDTYWSELRASEKGRNVIVKRGPDGTRTEVTPRQYSVGTAVHEYGAHSYTVVDGVVYFSAYDDYRLYKQQPGGTPEPLTREGNLRYAQMLLDRQRKQIICVREDHTSDESEAVNTIVGIDISGENEARVLISGNDFYASPRLSPDGTTLAWLTWDHPNMPWDGTELWTSTFQVDGSLSEPILIAGGIPEAIAQPEWSPDGTLYFISDVSGWSNLYRWRSQQVEPLIEMEAEFAKTFWWTGLTSYGFESSDTMICSYGVHGDWHLARMHLSSKHLEIVETGYPVMGHDDLKVGPGRVVFGAGSATRPTSVLELALDTGVISVLQVSITSDVDLAYLSTPESIEYPTGNDLTAHAYYYPPVNPDYVAPPGEKPLLLVTCHGGPIGRATVALDLLTQYWTSRGIGVLDVNYGGSTGHGRAYRERLIGEWGVVDVNDAVNGALYLAQRGDVDKDRLVITGGSAGGYTALAAMTFRDIFAAGASHFGVSDLESLLNDIHKFDTHSLDGLIGPYPLFRQRYEERSPINYADDLACPVIFFQGLDDTIVPADQSETMFNALKAKGIPTAYIAFEGEEHGFVKSATIRRTLEAELYFYSQVFGFELADIVDPVHIENAQALTNN